MSLVNGEINYSLETYVYKVSEMVISREDFFTVSGWWRYGLKEIIGGACMTYISCMKQHCISIGILFDG